MRVRVKIGVVLLGVLAVIAVADRLYAPPTVYPFGVTINRPGVYPGYVLYAGIGAGIAHLVDVDGNEVHRWSSPYPQTTLRTIIPLAEPGHIMARVEDDSGVEPPVFTHRVVEMDWDGNVVWEFIAPKGIELHHDHGRLENGNYLLMCSKELRVPAISDKTIIDDCLLEVDPGGNVVWRWQTADHFDDFMFEQDVLDSIFERAGDWAHANASSAIPSDTSHGDPRFRAREHHPELPLHQLRGDRRPRDR